MTKQLDRMNTEELGMLFPIIISDPDPRWTDLFNAEKLEIEKAIGKQNIIRIEHIGSTAVPNLKAKPTIDILLEVHAAVDTSMIIERLKESGYHYTPKPENPAPHMMFMKGYSIHGFEGQAYHVHVRYRGDWDEIYFRDYLKANPEIAQEYADLKEQLAKEFKNDREEYTAKKTNFIKRITEMARNNRDRPRFPEGVIKGDCS
jgi:GrpB-like predicted nucleotidyltransferase (UPF0157 family)